MPSLHWGGSGKGKDPFCEQLQNLFIFLIDRNRVRDFYIPWLLCEMCNDGTSHSSRNIKQMWDDADSRWWVVKDRKNVKIRPALVAEERNASIE